MCFDYEIEVLKDVGFIEFKILKCLNEVGSL